MFEFSSSLKAQQLKRPLTLVIFILSVFLLTGCGGTKVYKNDKTIAYNGSIYNLSNVMTIGTINTGKLSNDETVNLKGKNRKQIEALLKDSGPMYVRMAFDFDGKEMLYRASSVDSWSGYSKMQKSFDKAGKDVTSLMANKKKMQLKLK
jgi:predicted heme/steroid binding protein